MFSNEASLPYLTQVEPITSACMARVIAELRPDIDRPYGVNVLWDPKASIDVAVATGASFVREIFSGVYASDYGSGIPIAAKSSAISTRSAARISSCSSTSCPNRPSTSRTAT